MDEILAAIQASALGQAVRFSQWRYAAVNTAHMTHHSVAIFAAPGPAGWSVDWVGPPQPARSATAGSVNRRRSNARNTTRLLGRCRVERMSLG